ncbi:MAG: PSD1 and planctomycete cytochrome C domain-containing protein [Phycisphaeraceae bacterium]|nr:PSD1 and planctomycete cytochrome C domain-containing protein [Phycisphaeraceae bacterium]
MNKRVCIGIVVAWGLWGAGGAFAASPQKIQFNRDIRPIFSNTCFTCHGPDASARKAKLRLDVRSEALKSRKGLRPIVPGDPQASEAYLLITEPNPDDRMPPADFHTQLTDKEKSQIKAWIEQGAKYEKHWSFIPPKRPAVPKTGDRPIDAFINARLKAAGLKAAPQADRATLIRRVTFDLTGLPPTAAEIDAFLADRTPDAYEKVVDRLLHSRAYAEHMTRYWLDTARYADTNGYQYDKKRDQWVWRDWVIHAFATNKPFDRFTIEQNAGDLLPGATDQTRLATGFHRNHPITIEGGVIDEEYRTEYVMDRVVTTSTAWMGLTFICARCHDHKYDPLSQDDFYGIYAFFNNVPERGLKGFAPKKKIPSPLAGADNQQTRARLAAIEKQLAAQAPPARLKAWEARLKAETADAWTTVRPTRIHSAGGATLKPQSDGSVLATGKNPAKETYEVQFTVPDARRAIRLEALTDPSLKGTSTGRASNGNFVLSRFEVALKQGGKFKSLKIASASADYQQKGYPVSAALKAKGGWAVDGNRRAKPAAALFTLAEPLPEGAVVRVRLVHHYGGSHTIGRFRLSLPNKDIVPTPSEVRAALALPASRRQAAQKTALRNHLLVRYGDDEIRKLVAELQRLKAATAPKGIPETLILTDGKPRQTFVLQRGEYDKPIKDRRVQPDVPEVFGGLPKGLPRNRLGFAKWLVSPQNPLTARVTVNRYWARLFGTGLVKTVEDFGSQSEYPSHPQLLDWLAVEFTESGWDLHHLLKTIVTSDAYRRRSDITPALLTRDPENRLLGRGPRFRLDAESIRDSALAVSGLLNRTVGGPSVYPYHPKGLWLELNNRPGYSKAYPHTQEAAHLYRRSMYTYWKRTVPPPSMATFDAPEREFCVVSRSRTNTPLQAFVLLHDPQFVEAARHLAARMIAGAETPKARLKLGFKLCTARDPSAAELAILNKALDRRLARYRQDTAAAKRLLSVGASPRSRKLDTAEHAAYTAVARMLMNLSEFVTRG